MKQFITVVLVFMSLLSSGQRIGPCPPSSARVPENIRELRGVVVDENLAVVPKVKVTLQVPDGGGFREIGKTETGPAGQFSFEAQPFGKYRLAFKQLGFCAVIIPVKYSKAGFKGMRLTLPVAASESCPQDCDSRLKMGEMTGREGRE